jgi:hypothetical protein
LSITDIKLVSRVLKDSVDTTEFRSDSDIEFDEYGEVVLCTPEEAFEQNLLKCILTDKQLDGYGTSFKSLIGRPNTDFIRVSLMSEILSSVSTLKQKQVEYLSKNPTYDKKSIIGEVLSIKGNKLNNTSFEVICKLRSLNDLEKNTDTLQKVATTLTI